MPLRSRASGGGLAHVAALLGVSTAAGVAAAQAPTDEGCARDGSFVVMAVDAHSVRGLEADRVLSLTRVGMAVDRVRVCQPESADESARVASALARLEVWGAPDGVVTFRVLARGAQATAHSLALSTIPPDGRALAVATIAHEILRNLLASADRRAETKADVSVASAAGRARPPEPGVRSAIQLEAAAAVSAHAGGLVLLGPDTRASFLLSERLRCGGRLGLRAAPASSAPNGRVRAFGALAGIEAGERLAGGRQAVWLFQRLDVVALHYSADARIPARASPALLPAVVVSVGLATALRFAGRARLGLDLGLSSALLGAEARDDGRSVVALSGFGVEAALRLGWGR